MKRILVKKAYLPTLGESDLTLDDITSLRWIPSYRRSTFNMQQPVRRNISNIDWETRLMGEEGKKPLPGFAEGRNLTGYFLNPAVQMGALHGDVTFNDKGTLMGIAEKPHFWRTPQQGAANMSIAGEGFRYNQLPKEAFVDLQAGYTPKIAQAALQEWVRGQRMEGKKASESFDDLATSFPEVYDIASILPDTHTENIWGQPAVLTQNPLPDFDASQYKVASEPMDIAMRLLKRDLSEMTDYEIDRARFANDNQELQNEERTRAMDRMAEFSRQNVTPFDYGDEVEEAYDDIGDQDHSDYFGEDIDPNELYQYILENAGEEAAQNYVQQYKDARANYGGNTATMSQLDAYGISNQGDVNDFIESRESMTDDMRNIMPNDETVFDAFPYPEGVAYNNKLSPPFTTTPQNESNFQMKYTGEPMDIAFQLLKERVSPEAKRHKLEYDKKYESSPERVKYREDLNRERRRRGIYGSHNHQDVSHTEGGKLTLEGEHENRARHFKDKGTLREL